MRGWTDKQGLARKFFQSDPFISPKIACLATDQNTRTYSYHHPERGTYGGFSCSAAPVAKTRVHSG